MNDRYLVMTRLQKRNPNTIVFEFLNLMTLRIRVALSQPTAVDKEPFLSA
ncbi:Uncharacterised protein [Streptococcus pseudopneumoniae]|uniref:Uncharacterized protein n=1 Tax=Streptococcus pseudopneumoniae TaxID=257758 RepID=A0A0T8TM56_9STRE|nr:Uncharacterised protein [Streptococcus pseudopneumoniae]CKA71661.1 Uncharacterised protein [Streptococcus pseudopneumoniae]